LPQSKLHIFHLERSFNPFQSLLGKFIAKRQGDWLRGENYYILYAAAIAMVLMFANQVAWTFVKEAIVADPTSPTALWYWAGQLVGISGFILLCTIGFRSSLTISFDSDNLTLSNDDSFESISYNDISEVKQVSKLEYHRSYRPFANTKRLFNKLYDQVIVVRTGKEVFAFSFPHLDHAEFVECMETKLKSDIFIPSVLQQANSRTLDHQVA